MNITHSMMDEWRTPGNPCTLGASIKLTSDPRILRYDRKTLHSHERVRSDIHNILNIFMTWRGRLMPLISFDELFDSQ